MKRARTGSAATLFMHRIYCRLATYLMINAPRDG